MKILDTKYYFCEPVDNLNILPSPSTPILTNDMKENLKNACKRHKQTEIAKKLEINISILRSYMSRNSIVFTNEDPTKCYFCDPADNPDVLPSPLTAVLTNDMKEHLRNACKGHK